MLRFRQVSVTSALWLTSSNKGESIPAVKSLNNETRSRVRYFLITACGRVGFRKFSGRALMLSSKVCRIIGFNPNFLYGYCSHARFHSTFAVAFRWPQALF